MKLILKGSFYAKHHLTKDSGYNSKCMSPHYHNYTYKAIFDGSVSEEIDMIMDFKQLKELVGNAIQSKYENKDLNTFFKNPTAEIILPSIVKLVKSKVYGTSIRLTSFELYETPHCGVLWEEF